jgi:hypothetical protein
MGFFSNTSSIPSVGSNAAQVAGATLGQMPGYGNMLNQQANQAALSQAQGQLAAAQAVSPGYQELQNQMYQQYMPGLAQAGLGVGGMMQGAQAGINAAVAGGQGQQALQAAIAADQAANPEFYAARAAGAQGIGKLLGSIDLSGALSGGEQRAIQQSIDQAAARTGQMYSPSAINAASNAMQYGQAAYQRQQQAQQQMNQAIQTASGFLPQSQSGVGGMNAWNIATGGPNTATSTAGNAMGNFLGVNQGAGQLGASQAGNLMGQVLGGNQSYATSAMQEKANQPTGFQNVLGGINAAANLGKAAALV